MRNDNKEQALEIAEARYHYDKQAEIDAINLLIFEDAGVEIDRRVALRGIPRPLPIIVKKETQNGN